MKSLNILTLAAALLLLPLSARAADSSDTWITTKAKVAVLSSVGTTGTKVHVDTNDGLVTLHGTVASGADKTAAENAVRKLDGVKQVRNLLEVVAEKNQDRVSASDDDVETHAKNALGDDPVLKRETAIKVESVNKGTVVLSGKATSLSNHLRAIEDVRAVPGVRRVASTIESPDSKAVRDSMMGSAKGEKNEAKTTAEPAANGIADQASDAYITTKAKARLLIDSKTPATAINVDTDNGVVTLFGTVSDETTKAKAEEEVRKVDGVKQVHNEIEIVSADRASAVSKKDSAAERNVKRAVSSDESLSKASISVQVENGVARLTGKAPTEAARKAAEKVAKRAHGVRSVRNEIEVTSD